MESNANANNNFATKLTRAVNIEAKGFSLKKCGRSKKKT